MLHTKLTTEQFVQKAKTIHNNTYSYTKTNYINRKNKLLITCLKHGDFLQFPSNHLAGNGCPKCSNVYKYSTNEFINRANKIHNNLYDYTKTNYKSNRNKININCHIHGIFEQLPQNHLQGRGCPKCRNDYTGDRLRMNLKEFIEKANTIHGNRYSYNNSSYINSYTPIIITCINHGDFKQLPTNHLSGSGCNVCNSSKGELAIKAILDKHNITYIPQWKHPDEKYLFEYDFYLPEHNLLIEFHGIQHYEYNKFFHKSFSKFEEQKLRDSFKIDLARMKAIPLIEISYKHFKHMQDKQFEKMLLDKINKHFLTNIRG